MTGPHVCHNICSSLSGNNLGPLRASRVLCLLSKHGSNLLIGFLFYELFQIQASSFQWLQKWRKKTGFLSPQTDVICVRIFEP